MEVTIDRFEGGYAVCEKPDRTILNIPKVKLPEGVKDGDILVIEGDCITIDSGGTAARKKSIQKLMDDLWK